MAKGSRGRRRIASRRYRPTPYPLRNSQDILEDLCSKKCRDLEKKDWEDATCSVCMEYPHNAVLLLCSSHDKGCRPYMCGTSFRHSNCLGQYKKAYTKIVPSDLGQPLLGSNNDPIVEPDAGWPVQKCEVTELACPLCRGQVKGWTVLEPARDYLNTKRRSCMQENCSFVGNYKELKRHVKEEHPSACPREVDPDLEQKWRSLEHERETNDLMSTIQSSMPGAMVFGDYVIERNNYGLDSDEEDGGFNADAPERNGGFGLGFDGNLVNFFFLLHAFGPSRTDLTRRLRPPEGAFHHSLDNSAAGIRHTTPVGGLDSSDQDEENDSDGDDDGGAMSLASRLRRHGRVLLGRSGRRRMRREGNSDER
ncbi:hypothetical protein C1H46_014457 [Malus baccata]|uniref:Uncharacterized protein n=1 Tax=Malus baccata TaxID=106549 RepID=A0A540MMD2_MALBA|nr:hypothetical protein C1H46_014457 [Malus baccata]